MNADCGFRVGRTHAVCQDYAVAGSGEFAYALLADGCSSSPDTDIGARLLVKAAERAMPTLAGQGDWDCYHQEAIRTAGRCAGHLALNASALDATLLTVYSQGPTWAASIYGDGVLAVKERSGLLRITAISFTQSAPYYLNYSQDKARHAAYLCRHTNERKIALTGLRPDGSVDYSHETRSAADSETFHEEGLTADTDWVAVLSDGVQSFYGMTCTETSRVMEDVPLQTILPPLLDFKNTHGVFVQRRLQRFLAQAEDRGRQHHDDLAVGAVAWGR